MANKIPGSRLRTDILPTALKEEPSHVVISREYCALIENSDPLDPSTTVGLSKNIVEVMDLIKEAIEDYEKRNKTLDRNKVVVAYEDPDKPISYDTVTISIERRQPGAFGRGRPFENDIKNRRPILREEGEDPDHPGYRRAILGYFHDNIIRLTCWSLTNKEANARMLWLEEVIEQYLWYFRLSGVSRILYQEHGPQLAKTVVNNKLYGRPIDLFVRTETIRAVSEKELETIYINLALRADPNL